MQGRWYTEPLALKLGASLTVLVAATLLPGFYFFAHEHYESSLDLKRAEVLGRAQLVGMSVEHELLERDRPFVREIIRAYTDETDVERAWLVDRDGRVQIASDPSLEGLQFDSSSPECVVCHKDEVIDRSTAALVDVEHGAVMRSVYPMMNGKACRTCHGDEHRVLGLMLTDTDVQPLRAELAQHIRTMGLAVASIGALLLVGAIFLVRFLVLRPLARLEETAKTIGSGDLSVRVTSPSDDAIGTLGEELNSMADSVSKLMTELRRQQAQLENVMNSVDDGLLVVDDSLTVVAANQSLASRLGATRDEIVFRSCREVWGEDCECSSDASLSSCPARKCFQTGNLHTAFWTRYTEDGTARQEEVFASPIVDEDGKVLHVVEVWRDITERRRQEARLAEFQRFASLGLLASGFSHEVNTPLGTMLFCADDMSRLTKGAASAAVTDSLGTQAELIRGEILRCRKITQQFLSLSRGQSKNKDLVEIPEIARATITIAQHTAKDAGVTLILEEDESRPVTVANLGAVQQVLLNILINAVQATPAGGEVRIGWRETPVVAVWVRDRGSGMSEEVRNKALEPFYSGRVEGTGLGLFVSLSLARQWGGDIEIESEPGQGSTVTVTFPFEGES